MSPRAKVYVLGFPNGKCYVGVTVKTIEERFREHVVATLAGSKFAVHHALGKYGPENIKVMIVTTDVAWEQAQDLEVWWISRLNTFGKSGYNMTAGGEGTVGYVPSTETRAKISKAGMGRKPTAETRGRLSKASKEQHHLAREETITEMVGKRHGLWTVLSYNEEKSERRGASVFNCRCACGKEKPVLSNSLRSGRSKGCLSCACMENRRCKREEIIAEMVGKSYNCWAVLGYNKQESERRGNLVFDCRCACGVEKPILSNSLRHGGSKGCRSCASRGHKAVAAKENHVTIS